MSNVIHLLPDSVANQIAAGEVIQRPASVIKELVENAVDAGADYIRVFIKDAGRTLIQVIDNGKGMNEMDARMAFERHATSKITEASDLFTLCTMGFRGEALPSICAISQVEMRTKRADDRLGTCLNINCSKVESQEPCVCENGTNIMVRNIFCNLPARRRFLKSDNVELANIMREFERLALVNNHLHLSIDTGNKTIDLPKATLKQRIADIWKNNLNLQLLPVDVDTSVVKITGYVSRPEYARRRNPLQYLIVNGRNMRHPYFHKAITMCYQQLIAADTQPCYFIKFEVDPSSIDVNIHPTKNEIKFENEQEIWHILTAAVKAALGKFGAVPSIDFDSDALPVNSLPKPGTGEYNAFEQRKPSVAFSRPVDTRPRNQASDWGKLYNDFMRDVSQSARQRQEAQKQEQPLFDNRQIDVPRMCMQFALKYIITTSGADLLIIDQHRAHVRVLYENYLAKAALNEPATQGIMFAEEMELDASQHLTLEGILEQVRRLGFIIDHIDGYKWRISGVPASSIHVNARDMIARIIDSINDDGANYGNEGTPAESLMEKLALVTARASAITRGRKLSDNEMEALVTDLFQSSSPAFTPNGNPIYTRIDEARIQGWL